MVKPLFPIISHKLIIIVCLIIGVRGFTKSTGMAARRPRRCGAAAGASAVCRQHSAAATLWGQGGRPLPGLAARGQPPSHRHTLHHKTLGRMGVLGLGFWVLFFLAVVFTPRCGRSPPTPHSLPAALSLFIAATRRCISCCRTPWPSSTPTASTARRPWQHTCSGMCAPGFPSCHAWSHPPHTGCAGPLPAL